MKFGRNLTAGLAAASCALLMAGPAHSVSTGTTPSLACIDKSVSSDQFSNGDLVEYQITLRTGGTGTVENVTLNDPVPPELSGIIATPLDGGGASTCVVAGQMVDCGFGNLSSGVERNVQIQATLNTGTVGQIIGNTATIASTNVTPNPATCSAFFSIPDTPNDVLACRVTGGGIDEFNYWSYSLASAESLNGAGENVYTFGGQAGANTALQPDPKGEWTHHQKNGPDGMFVFHAGTASAPEATEITFITCSDPGYCSPARPAPAKQIDFTGIGSFRNIKDSPTVEGAGAQPRITLHAFSVHIEDLGEPGRSGKVHPPSNSCPVDGSAGALADCDCPDFYQITIHATTDPSSAVIYVGKGYINGGNLQIHPPTGFDTQASN